MNSPTSEPEFFRYFLFSNLFYNFLLFLSDLRSELFILIFCTLHLLQFLRG